MKMTAARIFLFFCNFAVAASTYYHRTNNYYYSQYYNYHGNYYYHYYYSGGYSSYTGMVAGSVIGGLIALGILITIMFVIICYWCNRKSRRRREAVREIHYIADPASMQSPPQFHEATVVNFTASPPPYTVVMDSRGQPVKTETNSNLDPELIDSAQQDETHDKANLVMNN